MSGPCGKKDIIPDQHWHTAVKVSPEDGHMLHVYARWSKASDPSDLSGNTVDHGQSPLKETEWSLKVGRLIQ